LEGEGAISATAMSWDLVEEAWVGLGLLLYAKGLVLLADRELRMMQSERLV